MIKDKVVLVTGAQGGIGEATVNLFAEAGARVIATDLHADLDAQDNAPGVRQMELDVSSESSWQAIMDDIAATEGGLDVLVNNAGVSLGQTIADISLEDWRWVMSVNLDGAFLGTKMAIPMMKEQGGAIVNVSSALAYVGRPYTGAVSVSKAGLVALTRSTAVEVAHLDPPIRVNAVLPGGVDTDIFKGQSWWPDQQLSDARESAARASIKDLTPMGRLAEPVEIAKAILFLGSDSSSFMTGAGLTIDGGFTAL